MFHECTWGIYLAECGLFLYGEDIYGLLCDEVLLCVTGKGCTHCSWPALWLNSCGRSRIEWHDRSNGFNHAGGWYSTWCVVTCEPLVQPGGCLQHTFGLGVS
jgi:hypothetical protein